MDLKSYNRWYDYSRARDAMFAATNTSFAPWNVAVSDDKEKARLNITSHLLSQVQVPYQEVPREVPVLPPRREPSEYVDPRHPYRYVPAKF